VHGAAGSTRTDLEATSDLPEQGADSAGRRQIPPLRKQREIAELRPQPFLPVVEHDGGVHRKATHEPRGSAASMGEVSAARADHQRLLGMGLEITSGAFRHAFVPEQLGLHKAIEALLVSLRMSIEDLLETPPVRKVRAVDLAGDRLGCRLNASVL
jgi:hypothetical protein